MEPIAKRSPIYLSPPHLTGHELPYVEEAFHSNWIAPVGPQIERFETEFAERVGAPYAVALSSGTAALHLALRLLGIGPGDEVLVSTLTFAASAFPVRYLGAHPTFIDSELDSWNMDPHLLVETLRTRARSGRLPRAVVLVHLYGQSANIAPILEACRQYEVPLVEDAAEALGATYHGRSPGTFGDLGIFSFNGNKIVTTSGGGMLICGDAALARQARKLATQAREPVPHYEHLDVGYNYRLSNLLAALGRGQLQTLSERVATRRLIFARYVERLGHLPGVTFMPEASWGLHSRWLSCLTLNPVAAGANREAVRLALAAEQIESRPLWKPLHLQPVFAGCAQVGGAVAEKLFEEGLCLPSGSSLSLEDQERIIQIISQVLAR